MAKYRNDLPQLADRIFLTDGGIETSLIFEEGFDLPQFAAFHVLKSARGKKVLRDYYGRYIDVAKEHGSGFVLESPTWRASAEWGAKIGYSAEELGKQYGGLKELLPNLNVLGGCCGTDHRHIEEICKVIS